MFLYDGDCGFCTKWATWLSGRAAPDIAFVALTQSRDDEVAGVTPADIQTASVFVDEAGQRHWGADGFARVFRRSRGPWAIVGSLGTVPGARALARLLYRLVARHRHRLPGPPGS